MGGSSSKIITKDVPLEEIKASSPIESTNFCPPFRKFRNHTKKAIGNEIQFTLEVEEPFESISMTESYFSEMEDAFETKTKQIELSNVLFDEHYLDRRIYMGKNHGDEELTLQIRSFVSFNTHAFNNILYELNANEELARFHSPYLNTAIDKYVIQTSLGLEGQEFPNSQVIVMEPIATNLSEIIRYRRTNSWPWNVSEFNTLASDLCQAVCAMHRDNISHNDIRPFNVYYSLQKNCYQLGGFSNCVKTSIKSNQVRASTFFGAPQLEGGNHSDLKQADIYSLGMTLLCAFYLCEPIDRKAATPYIRKYEDKYKIMKVIREMIMPLDRRSNIEDIVSKIEPGVPSVKMKTLIQSLQYKNSPKEQRLIKAKRAISEGYQRLGLWNEWRNNMTDAYELEEQTLDDYKRGFSLHELAKIECCRGETENAHEYARRASKIFRGLGYSAYDNGNVNEAINLFSKSIQSSKYFQRENDLELAKNLQGLALAHSEKGDYEVAKPLISEAASITLKNGGKDSVDYCKIKISEAKIESDYGEFMAAQAILTECLGLAQSKRMINEELGDKLTATILHDYGKCLMMKSGSDPDHHETIEKAQINLNQAMEINEKYPNNHIALASNVEAYGEVEVKKGNFVGARSNFRKAQQIRDTFVEQNDMAGAMDKEKADTLCNIAVCETELGELSQSLKVYNQALSIYRQIFGSDHNKYSAIAIGNMSRTYFKMNQVVKAKQCLDLATSIIEDVSGADDPDYEHFQSLKQKL